MKALMLIVATLLVAIRPTVAQTVSPAEQRLREQIKVLTQQLRTAETASATLQVEKGNLETKIKSLEKQAEEITKQMAADKDAAKAESEKLRTEIAAKDAEIAQTKDLLVKADTFGKQSAELAQKTEAERERLASENIVLKRIVSDQRMKNAKMLEIGNEILKRYEKFGLGTALTAREPFVGITRARLESLVEDYSGQLAAQRIRLDGTSPTPSSAGAKPEARPGDGKPPEKKRAPKP
jgi:hypothetical protein